MPNFKLGTHSRNELKGVHPDLVRVVEGSIQVTDVDFSVHDGIRTEEEQREFVKRGVSRTMDSRHLTGHAVDLVPYINGQLRWEWAPIYRIAEAVRRVSHEFGIPIRWGGMWDRRWDLAKGDPEVEVEAYIARRKAKGQSVFVDGPHYELPRSDYPA